MMAKRSLATKGVLLQAKGLTIRTRAGVNLLSDISFHIEPGELVALTGLIVQGNLLFYKALLVSSNQPVAKY